MSDPADEPWSLLHSAVCALLPTQSPAQQDRQLPASPADLFRSLFSGEYQQAQQAVWQRVRRSYEV